MDSCSPAHLSVITFLSLRHRPSLTDRAPHFLSPRTMLLIERSAPMVYPFLTLAFQSGNGQIAFRRATVIHVALVAGFCTVPIHSTTPYLALLIAGIVEGAWLLGWRLAQLPKSQALEFLLVTPLRPT